MFSNDSTSSRSRDLLVCFAVEMTLDMLEDGVGIELAVDYGQLALLLIVVDEGCRLGLIQRIRS